MSAPSSPERQGHPVVRDLEKLGDAAVAALAAAGVERLLPDATSPYLLIAEHAGNVVPAPWRDLGLAEPYLGTHFAVDIGVDALTRRLSRTLRAPAVIARYSRLFLDYNRPADEWDFMRPDLGGIPVPGNLAVDATDARLRKLVAWAPVERAIIEVAAGRRALISVHSFTPVMGGVKRNVDIGVLWREQSPFVNSVLKTLGAQGAEASFRIGDNEPYDWRQAVGYTLNWHGLQQGRPCLYLEVRNDLLADPETFERVSRLLENAFATVAMSLWPQSAVAV
ncbi:N-formylglutamate amidohydrolase [Mesorhizobium sp. M2A.F.Ca.ET.037.01.1.1]|nr:N-formylglutamate amidohydrolase [Mesorhizobium sp. M2A.F.Ca.ET.046.03.2.1]RUX07612.1 N-formylglutamate amidohydrolase [Mesorhizobium sp. M2A.F.Ca.ET.037.01.1.1]RUY02270.1 N-formylglutamate amidohydrolase [Mesorhizobium sp. M2A.F.Ca.ET.040.01.1.1]RWA86494.1 MAG: N-formylglutamate amidohydrolase [Mesorhizobium sp.]RWX59367.1 N-formylglutamate amidohydrolase [Mesorhizobium sp. M2A.F.Ca.ET.039.01.1.1]